VGQTWDCGAKQWTVDATLSKGNDVPSCNNQVEEMAGEDRDRKITTIKETIGDLFKLSESELNNYKVHLAVHNGYEHPLDEYLISWDKWVNWNSFRLNVDLRKDLIGRLIIDVERPSHKGKAFYLEKLYNDFSVYNILDLPIRPDNFPS